MPKRSIGRPKTRWEDDVLEDIENMNVHNWKKVVQNRQFPLRLDYGRSPLAYVNQRLQMQLGLLMMSDIPLKTC